MKCHMSLVIAVFITVLNITNGLIRNPSNNQSLSAVNTEFKNVDTCEMQTMAKDMMEGFLAEKDLFTSIMETLQNRLTENSLCSNEERFSVCKKDTKDKQAALDCTSEEYENLIEKFTRTKLCHSQIAFDNVLLKAFIDKDASHSAFNTILNNFAVVSECVDDELKAIYAASIKLFTDLKSAVIDVSEKLWSNKIVNVFKKREYLIAGILCELRKGNKSELMKNSMLFENVGIIKLNDTAILNEAFDAFNDYYYYIPYFATKLLEKQGLVERLIEIHEKLTTYRAKHLVSRLNEQSKDSVIINQQTNNALNNYKHHQAHNNSSTKSFVEKSTEMNSSNNKSDTAESAQNTNKNANEDAKNKNIEDKNSQSQNVSSTDNSNKKDDLKEKKQGETPNTVSNDKTENNGKNVETSSSNNNDINNKSNDKNDKDVKDKNNDSNDRDVSNKSSDNSNVKEVNTQSNENNNKKVNADENDNNNNNAKNYDDNKSSETESKTKSNPLYSIEYLQEHNVYDLLKGLIRDLNIVKFEKDEPTNYTDNEQIKKLIEDNFFDLNNSTMLVRLLMKPQVAILSSIESFILMTPSPDKDAKMYCKKTLKNGTLVDGVNINKSNEEEDLVTQFASKYNAVYEKIKLEELKEMDESNNFKVNKAGKVSALQIKNSPEQNNNTNTELNNGQSENNSPQSTTVAVVGDVNGMDTSNLAEENVDIKLLSHVVNLAYQNPNDKSNSIYMSFSSILLAYFILCNIF